MLKVYYDSRTGNVRRFVNKLNSKKFQCIPVGDVDDESITSGILITYTTGLGLVPRTTTTFLQKYCKWISSVSVSGNRNWGDNFGKALDKIVEQYPSIQPGIKFELQGGEEDLINFLNLHDTENNN